MVKVAKEAPPEEELPTGADREVSDIPKKHYKGEQDLPIPVGAWVRLGDHEDVPDRAVGHIAVVLSSPTKEVDVDGTDNLRTVQKPDTLITVRTRDEASLTISLPPEAFSEVSVEGRHGVQPIG